MSKKGDTAATYNFLALKARLGGVYFWDPEKSMCQTASKQLDVSTPIYHPQKWIIFRTDISCFALSNVMAQKYFLFARKNINLILFSLKKYIVNFFQ